MTDPDFFRFRREILKLGFHSYDEQQSVWKLAQRCARTSGLALGGMGAVGTAALGPGAAVGFLAGLATGTAACTAGSLLYREQIRQMLAEAE